MNNVNTVKTEILRKLVGLTDLWLHTLNMSIIWGKGLIAPDFSVLCNGKWIIIEAIIEYLNDYDIELNYINVYEADTPKNADYVKTEDGHKILNRSLSELDFTRPYRVKSIEVYKFVETNLEKPDNAIEYDGCIVFNFLDKRSFAISSLNAPGGMLEFIMDKTEIKKLTRKSNGKTLIS